MREAAPMTAAARGDTRAPLAMSVGWRIARSIAIVAALAVLALVIAHWTWRVLAPRPLPDPGPRETPQDPAAAVANAPWFGGTGTSAPATSAAAPKPASTTPEPRLIGLVAGRNGTGYALFRTPDRPSVLVAAGQEIAPGVVLRSITDAGVRVDDHGTLREIELRSPPITAVAARPVNETARSAPPSRSPAPGSCVAPGASGNAPVYRLNAELLTGIAAKPESWSGAFASGSDGLALREGNAFGAMLGMKPGDRLNQANGIPLRVVDDVLVAVIRPLLASQAVRVSGLHEGRPAEWVFVNASACP